MAFYYMVIELEVQEPDTYAEYVRRVRPMVEQHGGRYLVRGGAVLPFTGNWHPERVVILEFPSKAEMERWATSPEYVELAHLRTRSTRTRAIALDGYSPDEEDRASAVE